MIERWRFTNLDLRHIGNGRWRVITEFRYLHPEQRFTVPKGFETDLDSVPRIPFVYALLKGKATEAAVIHDWLYRNRKPRRYADKILLDAAGHQGLSASVRRTIWLGVRSGGWLHYKQSRD